MSTQDRNQQAHQAPFEDILADAFAVRPDPYRQVAIRAQVVAEMRGMKTWIVQAELGSAFAVQPSSAKMRYYRQMAVQAARQQASAPAPVPARGIFARALAFVASGESAFERRLNDCIEAVVSGRATTNDCLQQYPDDADRLAPLLGLAQGLRAEYASLPLDRRVSGVRWRVLRAAREPQTSPLTRTMPSGGILRHMQWAVPLTSGVAASFVLTFLAFQAYVGGSDGINTAPNNQASSAPSGDALDYAALVAVTDANPTLNTVRTNLIRVHEAVENNEAPTRDDLEQLAASTQALNEDIDELGGEELAAALTISAVAATTLEDAEALVAEEDQEALVSSIEAVEASRVAVEDEVIQNGADSQPPAEPEATPKPTDEPAPTETATPEPVDLEALMTTHSDLSTAVREAQESGVAIDGGLLGDYIASAAALELALDSPEGSSDAEFIRQVAFLAGEDYLGLLAAPDPTDEGELALLAAARDSAYSLLQAAVVAEGELPPGEDVTASEDSAAADGAEAPEETPSGTPSE